MKTKTKLVSTLVVWEQMHDALRAITKTETFTKEVDFKYGGHSSVKHVNYHVKDIYLFDEESKEYTYKDILSITVPSKIVSDEQGVNDQEVERYIYLAQCFILNCKELEKPKFTDFFDGLKELEKLPTEDDLKEYPKLVGHIELP
jgi:hypothetical protein